jgi:hypothetical protein
MALLGASVLAACSTSDDRTSCADLSARIVELETPSASADQSWNSVQEMAARTIERDALRAELERRGCS